MGIGTGTSALTAKVAIVGSSNNIQLIVTGYSTQSVATSLVQFTRADAAAGISAMLGLTALGSGANGDGGSILLNGKSSTTAAQAMGLINWQWVNATHASRTAKIGISAYDTAVRLGLEIAATGAGVTNQSFGGVINKTTRITSGPYAVLAYDEVIYVDTDGGAVTVNLPAGVEGTHYKIINCGSAGLNVTLDPNGTEQIYGEGAGVALTLYDGEVADIHFNATEGWF
jgi:hypothetical protein